MAGFATDWVVDHVQVELPDGRYVNVTVTNDGSGNDPDIYAELEEGNECVRVPWHYKRTILVDGIYEEDEEE